VHHLDRDQLTALLRAARARRRRDWVLLLVTYWHGLRASEAVNLTPAHFRDGFLTVQRLKGSLRTVQPLVEHADELLDERRAVNALLASHLARYGPGGRSHRLFPLSRVQFYRLMRHYGTLAALPRHLCHPHVLKHSIAMQTIKTAGIENVRQYLGHRSISSTGEYLRVNDDEASQAIAAATRLKPPRRPSSPTGDVPPKN
jgi:integrase